MADFTEADLRGARGLADMTLGRSVLVSIHSLADEHESLKRGGRRQNFRCLNRY